MKLVMGWSRTVFAFLCILSFLICVVILLRIAEASYIPGWVEVGGILSIVLFLVGILSSFPSEEKEKGL